MVFAPNLLRMAESFSLKQKKIVRVKIVSLDVPYLPSNFLPSLNVRSLFLLSAHVLWAWWNCFNVNFSQNNEHIFFNALISFTLFFYEKLLNNYIFFLEMFKLIKT